MLDFVQTRQELLRLDKTTDRKWHTQTKENEEVQRPMIQTPKIQKASNKMAGNKKGNKQNPGN